MAMYQIRKMRLTATGDFHPAGKRARWYASDDNRMVVDGVYMLPGRGNEYYRVEKKLGSSI